MHQVRYILTTHQETPHADRALAEPSSEDVLGLSINQTEHETRRYNIRSDGQSISIVLNGLSGLTFWNGLSGLTFWNRRSQVRHACERQMIKGEAVYGPANTDHTVPS